MADVKFIKGLEANIPTGASADADSLYFATDTGKIKLGNKEVGIKNEIDSEGNVVYDLGNAIEMKGPDPESGLRILQQQASGTPGATIIKNTGPIGLTSTDGIYLSLYETPWDMSAYPDNMVTYSVQTLDFFSNITGWKVDTTNEYVSQQVMIMSKSNPSISFIYDGWNQDDNCCIYSSTDSEDKVFLGIAGPATGNINIQSDNNIEMNPRDDTEITNYTNFFSFSKDNGLKIYNKDLTDPANPVNSGEIILNPSGMSTSNSGLEVAFNGPTQYKNKVILSGLLTKYQSMFGYYGPDDWVPSDTATFTTELSTSGGYLIYKITAAPVGSSEEAEYDIMYMPWENPGQTLLPESERSLYINFPKIEYTGAFYCSQFRHQAEGTDQATIGLKATYKNEDNTEINSPWILMSAFGGGKALSVYSGDTTNEELIKISPTALGASTYTLQLGTSIVVSGVQAPINNTDAANKQYVDTQIASNKIQWEEITA